MAKELKITFTGGDNLGDERMLTVDHPILVGRSHSADIQVSKKDADVSGRHVEFREEGTGLAAVCVSRNGFMLNGKKVAEGESRSIRAGDVLSLGQRVRLRIDAIGGSAASQAGATVEDSETVAMDASATFATQAAEIVESSTFATRAAVNETFATRPVEATFATRAVTAVSTDSADFGSEGVTQDKVPVFSAAEGADAQTFTEDEDSVTGSGEGKTMEMHTRIGSMDEIMRMKRVLEVKKRQRTRLLVFSFFAFMAIIGTIVFVRWPRAEKYLTLPVANGKEPDMATHDIIGPSGSVEMTIGYPNDKRAQVNAGDGGVAISTYIGKDRDVPFRIQLERVKSAAELERSLAESAEVAVAVYRSRGCDFIASDDGAGIASISKAGIRFFEIEDRGTCRGVITQRGTAFIRREYVKAEGGNAWHGNLTVFRNGDVCYRLAKEIPEDDWPRGKYRLRESFLSLQKGFLSNHWESPGKAMLVSEGTDDQLTLAVRDKMDTNRVSEWPEISAMIDTLIVRSWNGPDDRRRAAQNLLQKFRGMQNKYYSSCQFRFDAGVTEGGKMGAAKMRDAYQKCRVAFGWNENDRRGRLINDPKEWKCQSKQ